MFPSVLLYGSFPPNDNKGRGSHERRYRTAGRYRATASSVVEGHASSCARSNCDRGLSNASPHTRPGWALAGSRLLGDGSLPEGEASLSAMPYNESDLDRDRKAIDRALSE